jgi:uncharacterized protein YceK
MKNFLLLIITAIIMGGCASNEVANSGDVKQSTIYQEYRVTFDEEDNITWAWATFRFGGSNGTTLVLTKPSTVTFNGDSMLTDVTVLGGAKYKLAFKKPLGRGQPCEFVFTDTDGKTYTNKIKFNPVLMGTPVPEVKKGMPFELPIFTDLLTYGEKIRITFRDSATSEVFETDKITPNKSILIPATVLKPLNGKVTFDIERTSNIPMQQANEKGGSLTFSYRLKRREVIIVD